MRRRHPGHPLRVRGLRACRKQRLNCSAHKRLLAISEALQSGPRREASVVAGLFLLQGLSPVSLSAIVWFGHAMDMVN